MLVFGGGRSTGKELTTAMLMHIMFEKNHNIVIINDVDSIAHKREQYEHSIVFDSLSCEPEPKDFSERSFIPELPKQNFSKFGKPKYIQKFHK